MLLYSENVKEAASIIGVTTFAVSTLAVYNKGTLEYFSGCLHAEKPCRGELHHTQQGSILFSKNERSFCQTKNPNDRSVVTNNHGNYLVPCFVTLTLFFV